MRSGYIYDPGFALFPTFIVSCILFFSPLLLTRSTWKWLTKNFRKVLVGCFLLTVLIVFAFMCLRSGIVVDETGIRKTNCFGRIVEEYDFDDAIYFEMSVQYGVQYDIAFCSGKTVSIMSHQIVFLNAFKDESYMKMFDENLSKYAVRNVVDSYRAESENLRRFFKKDEVFYYFDEIFNP